MREEFRTPFWYAASESLLPAVRRRYLPQLQAAERWELALDAAIAVLLARRIAARATLSG